MGTLLPTWEKTGNTDSADAATPDVWNAAVTTPTAEPATLVMPPRIPKPAVASSSAASVAAAIPWFAASSWRSTASKNLPSYLVSWLAAVQCAPAPSSSRRSSAELRCRRQCQCCTRTGLSHVLSGDLSKPTNWSIHVSMPSRDEVTYMETASKLLQYS